MWGKNKCSISQFSRVRKQNVLNEAIGGREGHFRLNPQKKPRCMLARGLDKALENIAAAKRKRIGVLAR